MQKKKYSSIVCFGEVLWDKLPTGAKPGGAPLNVAVHLKKLGQNPRLISKIGNDPDGKKLIGFLKNSGLSTDLIQIDEQLPTSEVLVHLDKQKNATYEICEPVAWDNIQQNKEIGKVTAGADLIIFGTLASRNKTTLSTLVQIFENSKATRLLDVNLRPPFDKKKLIEKLIYLSDFAKLNDDELLKIASWNNVDGTEIELIRWFSEFYQCQTICVTRGANGAILFYENKIFENSGFTVDAVDTVGAGDSFLASLVANLSNNVHPEKVLERACATGSFVASQMGAVPDYSEKEILEIIKSGYQ